MSNKQFTYLESGTLIDIGTILKVMDGPTTLNGIYEITSVRKGKYGSSVTVALIKLGEHGRGPDEGYSINDLEDLRLNKLLTVYNTN